MKTRVFGASAVIPLYLFVGFAFASVFGDETTVNGLDKAREKVETEIKAAKNDLVRTREENSRSRIALQSRLAGLEDEVASLRPEWRLREIKKDRAEGSLAELKRERQLLCDALGDAGRILNEIRCNTQSRFSLLDDREFAGELKDLDEKLSGENLNFPPRELARSVLDLLTGHVWKRQEIGLSDGTAIGTDGKQHEGKFVRVGGAATFFTARDAEENSGLVCYENGSSEPHVRPCADVADRAGIVSLASRREAVVPFDLTGGSGLKAIPAEKKFLEQMSDGGPVMIPLALLAAVCALVGAVKAVQLYRTRPVDEKMIGDFVPLLFGGVESSGRELEKYSPPLHGLLELALRNRDFTRERLEEMLQEKILSAMPRLESRLSVLSVGAAVAPLLGLLGTVTGMIRTFRLISIFGTGDARLLSGGISEALVTTEAGLAVAIPLLLLHALLSRRVRAIGDGLDAAALAILEEKQALRSRTGDRA